MSGPADDPVDADPVGGSADDAATGDEADDTFDEIREAATAVIASLKQLIDATERVVLDPGAFAQAVDGGKSVVEAFLGGFMAQASPDGGIGDDASPAPNAESDDSPDES